MSGDLAYRHTRNPYICMHRRSDSRVWKTRHASLREASPFSDRAE